MYFCHVAIKIVEEGFSSFNWLALDMSRKRKHFCSREYADVKRLVSHLSDHIQESLTVTCPFDGCSKTFNIKTSFSSHISRYHRGRSVTQTTPVHLCEAAEQYFPGERAHVAENIPEGIDVSNADQSKAAESDKVQDSNLHL